MSDTFSTAGSYPYARYLPRKTKTPLKWEPLKVQEITERGLFADPEKKSLLSTAVKVKNLTPDIGTEISGIDLRNLTDSQKDELALLVAERSVVFLRDQEIDIYDQLDFSRYYGPLHTDALTAIPREVGLEEVHVVYAAGSLDRHFESYSAFDEWHADESFEIQPPGMTTLKIYDGPEVGGDTLWSSGYALYSSLSPQMQQYLEGFSALHSQILPTVRQEEARRPLVETVHPVVRVHPVTGWKSIFVNHGHTRRILGIPKAESDAILDFLYRQAAENPAFQVRYHWEPKSVAIWDNRVVTHSAIYDYEPASRHALRTTPQAEKPLSVKEYEAQTGKIARDRKLDLKKQNGSSGH